MSSRIEQIIEEIKDYIDSCKFQPLSTTKIVVNKEELEDLLCELRMKTPDEIKRYQKIISNKDSIIQDAKNRAEAEIAEATAKAQQLVSENEVMRMAQEHAEELLDRAQKQAQEIIDNEKNEANRIRMRAISYTDEMFENQEKIMEHTMETAGAKYETFLNSIQSCYDIVNKNRQELSPQEVPSSYIPEEEEEEEEE